MGYALLFESMLDSLLAARDKWLVPGGAVLPDKATIWVAGADSTAFGAGFWQVSVLWVGWGWGVGVDRLCCVWQAWMPGGVVLPDVATIWVAGADTSVFGTGSGR